MKLEAVVLTGGRSARMGADKSSLLVGGRTLLERTLSEFDRAGVAVTVLGRSEVPGRAFLPDEGEFAGPAQALKRFRPGAEAVFVCACDLPRFDGGCVPVFAERTGVHDAVAPVLGGRAQTLCALYSARVFERWRASDARAMRGLFSPLDALLLDEERLRALGLDPESFRDADSPADLA